MERMLQSKVDAIYSNGSLEYNKIGDNLDFHITTNDWDSRENLKTWYDPWDIYDHYHHYYSPPMFQLNSPDKHRQGIAVAKALVDKYVVSIKTIKEFFDFVDTIVGAL